MGEFDRIELDRLEGVDRKAERIKALREIAGRTPSTRTGGARMSEKILVAREKHGDQYFGASTPEELAKSALKLLTSRWNEGYWYADPDDDGLGNSEWAEKRREDYLRALAMSQKEIDALPTNVQKEILNLRQEAKKDSEYDQKYRKWYEKAKKVVEDQDLGSYTLGRGRYERQEPKAWHLLKYRSDHEYEGVSLEEIH